jgi:hypothetical protein
MAGPLADRARDVVLIVVAIAVGRGDRLPPPDGGPSDRWEDVQAVPLRADLEIHAVGPDIDEPLAPRGSPAPGLVSGLRRRLEAVVVVADGLNVRAPRASR